MARIFGSDLPPALVFPREPVLMLTAARQHKYAALKQEKKVVPTLTPTLDDLATLGIEAGVLQALRETGLAILANSPEVPTYNSATVEFISSFETVVEDGRVSGWRFRLGNMSFERSRAEICSMLGFSLSGIIPACSAEERSTFMRVISPFDRFTLYMSPQNIQDMTWKYLHRIIAIAINPRLDGGRFISLSDMDILVHLSRGSVIDWFGVLTTRILEWGTTLAESKNAPQVLGGGLFITRIATAIGFDMSTAGIPQTQRLTLKKMRGFKMIMDDNSAVFTERLPAKLYTRIGRGVPPVIRPPPAQEAPAQAGDQTPRAEHHVPLAVVSPFGSSGNFTFNYEEYLNEEPDAPHSPQTSAAGPSRTRERASPSISRRLSRVEQTIQDMQAAQTRTANDSQSILAAIQRMEERFSGAGPSRSRATDHDSD